MFITDIIIMQYMYDDQANVRSISVHINIIMSVYRDPSNCSTCLECIINCCRVCLPYRTIQHHNYYLLCQFSVIVRKHQR